MPLVKISTLVRDLEIFPRHSVDDQNVRYIMQAIESGTNIPAIIADRETKKVIDGFHRIAAVEKLQGDIAKINVEYRRYPDQQTMFLDAMRLNATHGNRLTSWDKALCITKAEAMGLTRDNAASALSLTREKYGELHRERYATVHRVPYALKRTATHLAGQDLSDDQHSYNEKAGGMNQLFYVNQVALMLEKGTIDGSNDGLRAGLENLYLQLGAYLT